MAITDDQLRAACGVRLDVPRLEQLREEEHELWLGLLAVHRTNGSYRLGWAYDASSTTRLIKRRIDDPARALSAFGVVLRQFDRASEPDDPPEMMIGWVPASEEAALDGWLARLNALLTRPRPAG